MKSEKNKTTTMTRKEVLGMYYELNPSGHYFDLDTIKFFNAKWKGAWTDGKRIVFIESISPDRDTTPIFKLTVIDCADGYTQTLDKTYKRLPAAREKARYIAQWSDYTAREIASLQLVLCNCARAKLAWEKAEGTDTDEVKAERECAKVWSARVNWAVRWDSLHPTFINPAGEDVEFFELSDVLGT